MHLASSVWTTRIRYPLLSTRPSVFCIFPRFSLRPIVNDAGTRATLRPDQIGWLPRVRDDDPRAKWRRPMTMMTAIPPAKCVTRRDEATGGRTDDCFSLDDRDLRFGRRCECRKRLWGKKRRMQPGSATVVKGKGATWDFLSRSAMRKFLKQLIKSRLEETSRNW